MAKTPSKKVTLNVKDGFKFYFSTCPLSAVDQLGHSTWNGHLYPIHKKSSGHYYMDLFCMQTSTYSCVMGG